MLIFLDSGPLGMIANPSRSPATASILQWALDLDDAGHIIVVPASADYEVRRELERIRSLRGIATLDAWNSAEPNRYLPLSDSALKLASKLWAKGLNSGTPTGDPNRLDGDCLIAAQVLDYVGIKEDFVVATLNVRHLSQFLPADLWTNIKA